MTEAELERRLHQLRVNDAARGMWEVLKEEELTFKEALMATALVVREIGRQCEDVESIYALFGSIVEKLEANLDGQRIEPPQE